MQTADEDRIRIEQKTGVLKVPSKRWLSVMFLPAKHKKKKLYTYISWIKEKVPDNGLMFSGCPTD